MWLNALCVITFLLLNISFSNAQIPWTENFDSYTAGTGVDGTGNLGDYPGSVSQWTISSTTGLIDAGDFLKTVSGALQATDVNSAIIWTSQSINISACTSVQFSLDIDETGDHEASDYADVEYSINGGAFTMITNWNGNGSGTHTLIGDSPNDGDWVSETVTQAGLSGASLVIRITMLNGAASEHINIDNITVTGTACAGGNSITTGALSGGPFNVDCTNTTTDAGSVVFTSTGTFNGGNIYTAQLSDASGSFASPIDIGTLASTANAGSINFTLPSTLPTGVGYLIQIVASNPVITGSTSGAFTITQDAPCVAALPSSQGLLINEWSNGASGSKEYYEFVVAGQCGELVDIRGYILDDNNGTFSATFPSTSGVAQGHLKLTNDAMWSNIPVGSLIVIYNADDINANFAGAGGSVVDDFTDTNNDSLYVIPHNNATYFDITGQLPNNNTPDSTYTPVTYGSTSWSPLGLRNGGDAIQVRAPDGSYWHGISYGGSEITGGPNDMKISTSGMGGNCGWFTDGDYLDVSNWSTGSVGANETPGLPNNALNLAWLRSMRDTSSANCPITTVLPVELIGFDGEITSGGNYIYWQTASEVNSSHYILERSSDGKNWEEIKITTSAGNSEVVQYYSFIDNSFDETLNYYRLSQFDIDGHYVTYTRYVVLDNRLTPEVELIKIVNIIGQEINSETPGIQVYIYNDGSTVKVYK